jgi:putative DNA primase/helicase
MCYDSWLESEHKGMRMQMSRKAFIARIAELACADGEWMQDKGADGKVRKTNCNKWCPDLRVYKKAQRFDDTSEYIGFNGRQRGFYRTKVFNYCRFHNTTPVDLGDSYEAVRMSLGIVNPSDNQS